MHVTAQTHHWGCRSNRDGMCWHTWGSTCFAEVVLLPTSRQGPKSLIPITGQKIALSIHLAHCALCAI